MLQQFKLFLNMRKFLSFFIIFGILPVARVNAVENPYAFVLGLSSVNVCLVRFGYLTEDQAIEILLETANENGISNQRVMNLFDMSSFDSDMDQMTEYLGGCSQIVSEVVGRKKRLKRSLTSQESLSDLYYGPDYSERYFGFTLKSR